MLENPSIQSVLVYVTPICKGFYDVRSDNPSGADNQQGSPSLPTSGGDVTPQRLHAELLAVGAKGLEAYLQGALRDATRSALHRTHRFSQSNADWLTLVGTALSMLGHRSWMYREGRNEESCGCSRRLRSSCPWTSIRSDSLEHRTVCLTCGVTSIRTVECPGIPGRGCISALSEGPGKSRIGGVRSSMAGPSGAVGCITRASEWIPTIGGCSYGVVPMSRSCDWWVRGIQ